MPARDLELAADQLKHPGTRQRKVVAAGAAAAANGNGAAGWPPQVGDAVLDLVTMRTGVVLGGPFVTTQNAMPYHVKLDDGTHAARRLGELEKPKAAPLAARR